jgi:hypothetical protein
MMNKVVIWACALLAGCTYGLDPVKSQEGIAEYMTYPLHKAAFMNKDQYRIYYVYGQPDVDTAVSNARNNCRAGSLSAKEDPQLCIPIYADETPLVNLQLYYPK